MNLKTTNKPVLIKGGFFEDQRGRLDFVNEFDLTLIKRFYFITNSSTNIVRSWQGHKIESRWFYCVKGSFKIKIIKIDDWQNPSENLKPITHILNSETPQVLYIPNGYVNGIKAIKEESKLMILSDYKLGANPDDDYRFESNKWKKSND